jgi:hypothetical protein
MHYRSFRRATTLFVEWPPSSLGLRIEDSENILGGLHPFPSNRDLIEARSHWLELNVGSILAI